LIAAACGFDGSDSTFVCGFDGSTMRTFDNNIVRSFAALLCVALFCVGWTTAACGFDGTALCGFDGLTALLFVALMCVHQWHRCAWL
jgi:hypothetical protein